MYFNLLASPHYQMLIRAVKPLDICFAVKKKHLKNNFSIESRVGTEFFYYWGTDFTLNVNLNFIRRSLKNSKIISHSASDESLMNETHVVSMFYCY